MRRFLALLALFLLAACGSSAAETAVTNSVNSPSPSAGENVGAAPDFTPAATVEEAAQLRGNDHTHGAENPAVTIIEYGDFQ